MSLDRRGRRECGVTTSPMARLQQKSRRQSPQVGPDQPAFPARWCYGLYRALPGDLCLVATVIPEKLASQELSACFGAPGPHGLAVRARVSRLLPRSRPPHPASTFVTTRTPLFDEAGRRREYTVSDFRKDKFLGVENRRPRSD